MINKVEATPRRFDADETGKIISVDFMELRGLSTDVKPTQSVANGSTFLETDTFRLFFFDEENGQWIAEGADDNGGA